MDSDGLDAHLLARPHDPASDLAAISDQNFANFPHLVILLTTKTPRRGGHIQQDRQEKQDAVRNIRRN